MTSFYNFAFKIETVWAESVETSNASDVIVYVWFIQSWIKKFKNIQCKKE